MRPHSPTPSLTPLLNTIGAPPQWNLGSVLRLGEAPGATGGFLRPLGDLEMSLEVTF